ncbi:MAG: Holliday junction resolvase RuvX [Chloroflexales bacterium]|nr:Holliday junction resolvase RuvX [Chloroflexales bacterium]
MNTDKRVLALDVGTRRIGVAMSDASGTLATPLTTLRVRGAERVIAEIVALVRQHAVTVVVVGWPLNMNGDVGPQAESVRAFGEALEAALGQPVAYFDERLTSVVAEQILRDMGLKPEKRRERIDEVAASIILQDYLDHHRAHARLAAERLDGVAPPDTLS